MSSSQYHFNLLPLFTQAPQKVPLIFINVFRGFDQNTEHAKINIRDYIFGTKFMTFYVRIIIAILLGFSSEISAEDLPTESSHLYSIQPLETEQQQCPSAFVCAANWTYKITTGLSFIPAIPLSAYAHSAPKMDYILAIYNTIILGNLIIHNTFYDNKSQKSFLSKTSAITASFLMTALTIISWIEWNCNPILPQETSFINYTYTFAHLGVLLLWFKGLSYWSCL